MKDYLAEFIGTFALVFAITATIVGTVGVNSGFGVLNLLAIAFTAGLVLMVLIFTFGPLSGAHFNPAVTIGLWFAGKFQKKKVIPYLIAQFAGGLAASLALWVLVFDPNLGATTAGSYGTTTALLAEIVATALFLIVILSVTGRKESQSHAPFAIGFYLLVAHLYAIPFSGASLNPARSLGPALFDGGTALNQLWIYFLGPVIGALLGAIIYQMLMKKN